jgi:hypothetical protein
MPSRRKVLIDTDPGLNHFVNFPKWDAKPGWEGTHGFRAHDHFFTYAEQIGRQGCRLPLLDIDWRTTRPPVVTDCWPIHPPGTKWTTVMTWDNSLKPISYGGRAYGTKQEEFGKIEHLPEEVPAMLEVAAGGTLVPRDYLRTLGWSVIDSHDVSRTAEAYRSYIHGSRGEFSVAKNLYVATRSGWFSCRSVCYLAAGRPVVVQDTGFSEFIPTGEGLFAFESASDAAHAIATVERDYSQHSSAARNIALECFDSRIVLTDLLHRVGLGG